MNQHDGIVRRNGGKLDAGARSSDCTHLGIDVSDVAEGRLLVEQQVEDTAQRPHVRLGGYLDLGLIGSSHRTVARGRVRQRLRTDVVEGAGLRKFYNARGVQGNIAGYAKID